MSMLKASVVAIGLVLIAHSAYGQRRTPQHTASSLWDTEGLTANANRKFEEVSLLSQSRNLRSLKVADDGTFIGITQTGDNRIVVGTPNGNIAVSGPRRSEEFSGDGFEDNPIDTCITKSGNFFGYVYQWHGGVAVSMYGRSTVTGVNTVTYEPNVFRAIGINADGTKNTAQTTDHRTGSGGLNVKTTFVAYKSSDSVSSAGLQLSGDYPDNANIPTHVHIQCTDLPTEAEGALSESLRVAIAISYTRGGSLKHSFPRSIYFRTLKRTFCATSSGRAEDCFEVVTGQSVSDVEVTTNKITKFGHLFNDLSTTWRLFLQDSQGNVYRATRLGTTSVGASLVASSSSIEFSRDQTTYVKEGDDLQAFTTDGGTTPESTLTGFFSSGLWSSLNSVYGNVYYGTRDSALGIFNYDGSTWNSVITFTDATAAASEIVADGTLLAQYTDGGTTENDKVRFILESVAISESDSLTVNEIDACEAALGQDTCGVIATEDVNVDNCIGASITRDDGTENDCISSQQLITVATALEGSNLNSNCILG